MAYLAPRPSYTDLVTRGFTFLLAVLPPSPAQGAPASPGFKQLGRR